MVNVGKRTIHGWYGYRDCFINHYYKDPGLNLTPYHGSCQGS